MSMEVGAMRDAYRVGCDIGGTFTDFVLINTTSGQVHTAKRLTSPADPSLAMLMGLEQLRRSVPDYATSTERLAHATTLVANAVVERTGAKTAILCTAGFRDVIELRRYVRVTTYELFADPPLPLVRRSMPLLVNVRTRADGSVLKAIDSDEIALIAARLAADDVRAVAVCFLHAFSNPANERIAGELLARLLPGVAISLSSDVLPQIKEYERSSTTVINAYVKPLTAGYLGKLARGVAEAGFRAPLQIMLSNGGIGSARLAAELPVRLIESGPVAGAVAARHLARMLNISEILAYDMGGPTEKACLIRDGALPMTDDLEVARTRRFTKSSGFPVAIPAVNMIEIGAGGGSIARVNALGIVEVGPQSAGADPGPACYGLGGKEPTVSDADLVLGYLDPEGFAGGRMRLNAALAESAIESRIASSLSASTTEAAWIIHDVVNEAMAAAVRMHVSERGGDPSRPLLLAFGGAGPVHVCNLAVKLGIRRILVPLQAGVLSALGLVLAPAAFDIARTRKVPVRALNFPDLAQQVAAMQEEIAGKLREVDAGIPRYEVALGLGYIGQSYHVPVSVDPEGIATLTAERLLQAFAAAYRGKYGYYYDDVAIELVTVHVTGVAGAEIEAPPGLQDSQADAGAAWRGERPAYSARRHRFLPFTRYRRDLLRRDMVFEGPCLIEEDAATTVVDVGARVVVDQYGSLDISLAAME